VLVIGYGAVAAGDTVSITLSGTDW